MLLAGATGLIGGAVLRRLGAMPQTPALVVSRRRPNDAPSSARIVLGNLDDPAQDGALRDRLHAAAH